MQCQDHPSVTAIENCALCDKPLCGLCANYMDTEVLCEKCVATQETEKFVASQAKQHEKPEPILQAETADAQGKFEKPEKESNSRQIQWIIIAVCFSVMAFQLYRSQSGPTAEIGPELQQREIALTTFAQCFILFREIGVILESGGTPDDSMRCENSGANLVEQIDGDIRISHPSPETFGYSQIYVSRENPEPIVVN